MAIDPAASSGKLIPGAVLQGSDERPVRPAQEGGLTHRPVEQAAEAADLQQQAAVVQEAAQHLNEVVKLISSNLDISVDDNLGQTVVKVVNRENEEVIRQIPSEEVLALMQRLSEISGQYAADRSGLLIHDQA
ncbi:hypothetical protein GCM10011348_32300 [Marinobacterium nitratireducens]|uniref:Flagellar protein FlaG n=1 Tax=Marinobacterium nitratireducens TaxID=518897 RepID=A0A917ZKQ2_9GAMM|nr:flagellar protein FlaG [Marinobacterium nitratireducens]GGO84929.1 hypothetical protein GCM10011348_32300 [Marinobacterium nitratireducens]